MCISCMVTIVQALLSLGSAMCKLPQDIIVIFLLFLCYAGESSNNMTTTLSVLLVLLKTTKIYLEQNPGFRKLLPAPDCYAQR